RALVCASDALQLNVEGHRAWSHAVPSAAGKGAGWSSAMSRLRTSCAVAGGVGNHRATSLGQSLYVTDGDPVVDCSSSATAAAIRVRYRTVPLFSQASSSLHPLGPLGSSNFIPAWSNEPVTSAQAGKPFGVSASPAARS